MFALTTRACASSGSAGLPQLLTCNSSRPTLFQAHTGLFNTPAHVQTIALHRRYRLGLYEPPLPPLELDPGQEQEWIELRPRWPLTSERAAGAMPPTRSAKAQEKNARSLTDETREALAAAAAGARGAPAAAAAAG